MDTDLGQQALARRKWPLRYYLFAGLVLILYATGLASIPLLDPDEGRYAEIAREMLVTGDLITPHLNGVVYLEKPPLYMWLEAGAIALFGSNEIAFRLCSVLAGLGGLGIAAILGRAMRSRRAGLIAAGILGTSPLYALLAGTNIIDMSLSFFVSASLACWWMAEHSSQGRKGTVLYHGVFAFAALAVMSKGLIGIVIPCGVIGAYLLVTGRLASLKRMPWVTGSLLFGALAIPWHVLVALRNPGFLEFYFVRQHLLRFATRTESHLQPFWFFAAVLAVGMLPWSGLWPGAVRLLRARPGPEARRERQGLIYLGLWAGLVLIFFSGSRSKLIPYVLPACLPLAVLGGFVIDDVLERRRCLEVTGGMILSSLAGAAVSTAVALVGLGLVPRLVPAGRVSPAITGLGLTAGILSLSAMGAWIMARRRAGWCLSILSASGLVGALLAVAPEAMAARTTRDFAAMVKDRVPEGEPLLAYMTYPQSLPVYLERSLDVAGFEGELRPGVERLPEADRVRRFPTVEEFKKVWESGRRTYVVVDAQGVAGMQKQGMEVGQVLVRGRYLMLVANTPERPPGDTPGAGHHGPAEVGL